MEKLTHFLKASPSPWHAVDQMEKMLSSRGFFPLTEKSSWSLQPGGRYFVQRQPGCLIAFIMPQHPQNHGYENLPRVRLVCAHTDSPGLKLKPNPCKIKSGYPVLDVEVYGSPLLSTWFDRDLGLAGQVTLIHADAGLRSRLLDFNEPVALLPSLAIHLNREANEGIKIRRHEDLSPVLLHNFIGKDQEPLALFLDWIVKRLQFQYPGEDFYGWDPVSWDLMLYDCAPAKIMGGDDGWVTGGRLDNLLSCFAAVTALTLATPSRETQEPLLPVLACFNHEESGSLSQVGAQGNFLPAVLKRLFHEPQQFERVMSCSTMVSVDSAHGIHPNFTDKYDSNNAPELNAGVVFKHNANQRYAHSVVAEGMLKGLCRSLAIPWQDFAMRADMPCGSTIGPTLSASLGLHAMDLGVASWAMHSIRETAGLTDVRHLQALLTGFFSSSR
ncbi:MAG: M18 family aminopeptidase [Magnetococcales bacterium]|nr:M18 family aminopeptidase [Magnetococcales bacterium]HIJ85626.1 M18 family aminopeptidase [Magnetococcales bacterium]